MEQIVIYVNLMRHHFWSERFWLPPNITWNDLRGDDTTKLYPQPNQLYASIPICGLLVIMRYIFERFIFTPLGLFYGLKHKETRAPQPSRKLENFFKKEKRPDQKQLQAISEEVEWPLRQVERWFRLKRNATKYSLLKKFSESGWRFTFYLFAFWGAIGSLWSKPYFWNTDECWTGYPQQSIDPGIYWFYMIELGFYWSLLISMFYDVKRKDFTEMVVHHISTVILIIVSWTCNFVRIGAMILAVHDAVDYILEAAKMAKYVGKATLCDVLFSIFTLVWFCTRLTIFPFVSKTTSEVTARYRTTPG